MKTETLQQRVDRLNLEMGFQPYSTNTPQFGKPIPTKTQMKKQAKAKRQAQYGRDSSRRWNKGYKVLQRAFEMDDEQLLYCWDCGTVIGWRHYRANHVHIPYTTCREHNGKCVTWYTDWRTKDIEEMATLEMPGTIWGEAEI